MGWARSPCAWGCASAQKPAEATQEDGRVRCSSPSAITIRQVVSPARGLIPIIIGLFAIINPGTAAVADELSRDVSCGDRRPRSTTSLQRQRAIITTSCVPRRALRRTRVKSHHRRLQESAESGFSNGQPTRRRSHDTCATKTPLPRCSLLPPSNLYHPVERH